MTTVSILSLVTTGTSSTENRGNLPVEGEAATEISKLVSVPPEPTASNSDEPSSDELRALAQEELVRLEMVGALTVEDVLGDEGSMKEIRQT
ncbi:MAG TPA: hypothetical protein VLK22_03070 [Candidatus Udaeobacter sp.]|nr:hypothetical protein [Candidatus Udaeobacter sp.]